MSDDVIAEVHERHRLAREAGIGVPMYEVALLAEIARFTAERDEARAEVERLRREAREDVAGALLEVLADLPRNADALDRLGAPSVARVRRYADLLVREAMACTGLDDAIGARDQARRTALEEAIGVCEARCKAAAESAAFFREAADEHRLAGDEVRWRDRLDNAHVAGASATTARELADVLRRLLDTPVRPAPVSASEET